MSNELGSWSPLDADEVARLLGGAEVPWWIAGGWAIDLHLGRQTRPHEDIDVLVLRPHLPQLREQLSEWDLHVADPPGTLRPWPVSEELPSGVHDVWCRPTPGDDWCLQLMIDDLADDHRDEGGDEVSDERDWVYRRDLRIRRNWRTLSGPASIVQRAVLAPEVQLLYKSADPRAKDEDDFALTAGALDDSRRAWLIQALQLTDTTHPWIVQLRYAASWVRVKFRVCSDSRTPPSAGAPVPSSRSGSGWAKAVSTARGTRPRRFRWG
ncbi:amino acid transporter [Kineococcus sp. NPDC059986]|uniref:nucleotidyltransferase domain-containing protein n=1 Tax=Kineococcus sp. NPDC059986 TaxID=3155538 RepID=UPI00344FCF99